MTQKAYSKGSEFPALEKDTLRAYSMRFCPYAHRTLLVLGHFNIPHEVVNINLKDKPDWFLGRTTFGLVPVLEKGDKIVFESSICDEYLDELYGGQGRGLFPSDPYEKARVKILMEAFQSKVVQKFYALVRECSDDDRKKALEDFYTVLQPLEDALSSIYFGGSGPGMLDYHTWPFFERIPAIQKVRGGDMLPADRFPKLTKWVESMKQLPAVRAVYHDTDRHETYLRSYLTGGVPDYDLGL